MINLYFSFTSAIRIGLLYFGGERFQFGGGEDLWVYINQVLVLSIISEKRDVLNYDVKCKSFELKNVTGLPKLQNYIFFVLFLFFSKKVSFISNIFICCIFGNSVKAVIIIVVTKCLKIPK